MPAERRRSASAPSRGTVLLVESAEPLARIASRALKPRRVVWVNSIAKAFRPLDATPQIETIVAGYRVRDGTARTMFSLTRRGWPAVRRVLYIEGAELAAPTAKLAVVMADVVITDFAELRRFVA